MVRKQVAAASARFHESLGLEPPPACCHKSPLLVTGHQPELFHPGVWAKNFAAHALTRRFGGQGLNLVVDNDVPHRTAIAVPHVVGDRLRTTSVAFDTASGEPPYEDYAVHTPEVFEGFPDRVREALGGAVADPVLDAFWPSVQEASSRTDRVGYRFTAARHGLERVWGAGLAEVPISALCDTEGFFWFFSHVVAHLERFQAVHNAALSRYRRLYGLRSHRHPVPDLGRRDDWLEAPFWVWRRGGQVRRRSPLLARTEGHDRILLRIPGEDEPFADLPLSADREACCAVDRLMELPAAGIRLRTRALTTTMFARLLLGDLFIHGIGGAKYDEVGDEIVRDFFGFEPPPYLTLSMTLLLGLPGRDATPDDLRAARRHVRDLRFNPDRHLTSGEAVKLVAEKAAAIDAPVATRRERVERFGRLRKINDQMAPLVEERLETAERTVSRIESELRWNAVARGREYALILHSQDRLRAEFRDRLPEILNV
jgi:hypothetical protein